MTNTYKNRFTAFTKLLAVNEWIFFSCAFSFLLLIVRLSVTQKPEFIFLPWNLFLAYIPYRLTEWLIQQVRLLESRWKLVPFLLVWLLFIPNSFYIITDLFHISKIRSAPQWFDLLLIFSFAWNGILLGVLSLRRVEMIVQINLGRKVTFVVVVIVMWLIAWGMYIGRYLRFNSWDIVTNPFALAGELLAMIFNPFDHFFAWGMSVCYAVFMALLYFSLNKMEGMNKTNPG